MTGPGPTDGTIETSNVNGSSGNFTVLNSLYLLLDAAAAADEGHWVDFFPFKGGTLEVTTTGAPTFSVALFGSNSANKPADSVAGSAIGSAITAVAMSQVVSGPRWIKANLSSITGGGTVSVTLNAFSP